jgi:hypothetical protein
MGALPGTFLTGRASRARGWSRRCFLFYKDPVGQNNLEVHEGLLDLCADRSLRSVDTPRPEEFTARSFGLRPGVVAGVTKLSTLSTFRMSPEFTSQLDQVFTWT